MLWYEARFDLGKKSPVGAMWGADGESFSDVEGIVFRGGWYCGYSRNDRVIKQLIDRIMGTFVC